MKTTPREYADMFLADPSQGIIALDLEEINRTDTGQKWQDFKREATQRLEQYIKDAAIFAAMP